MNVVEIGPSFINSKGGMATVIREIMDDKSMVSKYNIEFFPSFQDGQFIKRHFYCFKQLFLFKRIVDKFSVAHIHMASYLSFYRKSLYIKICKKHGKKVILHLHGSEFKNFYLGLSNRQKNKVRSVFGCCDSIIVLSEQREEFVKSNITNENVVLIRNGIDLLPFENIYSNTIATSSTFLALGRLGKRKGTYDIIKAASLVIEECPNLSITLAGDGEIDEVKKAIVKKHLEKNIFVVGWIGMDKKIALLRENSTVLLPSYNEGLPMSVLEGIASGKAIIASNVGGIPDVVFDGINGFLIQPGDIATLASSMLKIIRDNALLQKFSDYNYNVMRELVDSSNMHRKIADCFEKVERF